MTTTLLYLSWICRGTLAMVFAVSVTAKTRGAPAFARFRHATRTLTGLQDRRADVLAVLVVAGETAVAAGSIPARTAPWAAATAIVLLSLFSRRLARMPDAGPVVACGCFGSAATTRRVGLVRNALLLVVAAVGAGSTLGVAGTGGTDLAGVLVCLVAAVLLAAFLVRLNDITSLFPARL
ncbi:MULTISPECIES: MauE/DoxX family redox-associated membrane protein [Micromonospora]|uniref:MauE/DoxX family redox-associated membrane protein n=1 Tax=Micromonospora TaxID=1873 RepID=UPI0021C72985|nr:MauE/DoxX family redox-associated membrane protein [Micromonospora sp. Mcm103]